MVVSWIFFSLGILFLCSFSGALGWIRWKKRNYLALRQRVRSKKMDQERLSQAVKVKREMEALISSPGWKTLIEIAKTQMEGRTHSVLLKPTESPYEQEYLKGEIQGMKTLVAIPDVIVADALAIIDSTKTEEETE